MEVKKKKVSFFDLIVDRFIGGFFGCLIACWILDYPKARLGIINGLGTDFYGTINAILILCTALLAIPGGLRLFHIIMPLLKMFKISANKDKDEP